MLTARHALDSGGARPWAPHKAVPVSRVHAELPRPAEANALRAALRYRCGGDKLEVLAMRFAVTRSDMQRALNNGPTRAVLVQMTELELGMYRMALDAPARAA